MNCKNPCNEIPLNDPQPVMPWVQVQLMICFGMIKPEEAKDTLKKLEEEWITEEVVPDIIVDNGC